MNRILYEYDLNLTTWMYLSSLLMIALYFKFSRVWSIRNLDLLGLIGFAPGMLLVELGEPKIVAVGFAWLFVVGGLFLIRLLIDPLLVRRPLLEPNLSSGGMTFLGISLLVFLLVNVLAKEPAQIDLEGVHRLDELLLGEETVDRERLKTDLAQHGPGYPWLHLLPRISTQTFHVGKTMNASDPASVGRYALHLDTARTMAIASHLAVVIGMILIGTWHYDNLRTGIAAAVLYLLIPYTAQMTGSVDHVLPGALLVWSVVAYRRPWISGTLLGLATGANYYPLFLLPLWIGFYWQRGLWRFVGSFVAVLGVLVASLTVGTNTLDMFLAQVMNMFGWASFTLPPDATGFWAIDPVANPYYRIPVLAVFVALCLSFLLWPTQKNLGTLLSCSAAVMLGTQFWDTHGGGLYLAWYLPLLLLTIFRPNLEDRVALNTLEEPLFPGGRKQSTNRAA